MASAQTVGKFRQWLGAVKGSIQSGYGYSKRGAKGAWGYGKRGYAGVQQAGRKAVYRKATLQELMNKQGKLMPQMGGGYFVPRSGVQHVGRHPVAYGLGGAGVVAGGGAAGGYYAGRRRRRG